MPYTIYATGIAWRTDKITEDIAAMPQPWDIFWEAGAYEGKVALLSEERETIGMALLRKGIFDINTEDPQLIDQAVADLKELYDICNIKVDDIQYQSIPEGTSWLHQAWSGDMIAGYIYYLPKGTPATALGYWKADKGKVPGPERLLVDLRDDEEARALAPLAELHPRQRRRLLELRRLQRLPAAAERDRPGHARRRRRRAGAPGEQRADERRPRARFAAVRDADVARASSSGRTATRTSLAGAG